MNRTLRLAAPICLVKEVAQALVSNLACELRMEVDLHSIASSGGSSYY
jgi:hypothetical protein